MKVFTMSWLLALTLFRLETTTTARATRKTQLPSATVVGTVYCHTCFLNDLSKFNHFISGALVAVECDGTDSFRKEVKTDKHGKFKVKLPFSVTNHVKDIKKCSVSLVRSNDVNCTVASTARTSSLNLKSKKARTHIFSAGFFTFKPLTQPKICNQKPQIPNSPPSRPPKQANHSKNLLNQKTFFPFPPLIPNPFQPPPAILPPIIPSPPPSVFPPLFPSPPPSIFPPVFPTPPQPPPSIFPPIFPTPPQPPPSIFPPIFPTPPQPPPSIFPPIFPSPPVAPPSFFPPIPGFPPPVVKPPPPPPPPVFPFLPPGFTPPVVEPPPPPPVFPFLPPGFTPPVVEPPPPPPVFPFLPPGFTPPVVEPPPPPPVFPFLPPGFPGVPPVATSSPSKETKHT